MEFFLAHIKHILLVTMGVGLLLVGIRYHQKIKIFLLEVKTELGKVAWATRKELLDSTFVVIVITFIMALFIGGVDWMLAKILRMVFQ